MVLIGYWPLNETSGNTAKDVRNSHDGAVNGATVGATGILGKTAYDFDGSGDYVDVGNAFQVTGSLSISFWMKNDTEDEFGKVVTKRVNSSDGSGWLFYSGSSSGTESMTWFYNDGYARNEGDIYIQLMSGIT